MVSDILAGDGKIDNLIYSVPPSTMEEIKDQCNVVTVGFLLKSAGKQGGGVEKREEGRLHREKKD